MGATTAMIVLTSGRFRWSSPCIFNYIVEFQRMPRFDSSLVDAQPMMVKVIADNAHGDATLDENRLRPTTAALLTVSRIVATRGVPKAENAILSKLMRDA